MAEEPDYWSRVNVQSLLPGWCYVILCCFVQYNVGVMLCWCHAVLVLCCVGVCQCWCCVGVDVGVGVVLVLCQCWYCVGVLPCHVVLVLCHVVSVSVSVSCYVGVVSCCVVLML